MKDFAFKGTIKAGAPTIRADLTVDPPVGDLGEDELGEFDELSEAVEAMKNGDYEPMWEFIRDSVLEILLNWGVELATKLLSQFIGVL